MQTSFTILNSNDASSAVDTDTCYLNLARLMSSANRKQFHQVDKRGNAQLYTVAFKYATPDGSLKVSAAPNTYYVRRAVQAWHKAWLKMFRRLGLSQKDLGTYGNTLRPFFNSVHEVNPDRELTTQTDDSGGRGYVYPPASGEWTYSRAAVATPMEKENHPSSTYAVRPSDLVDTYAFTLLGYSVTEDTSGVDKSPDISGTSSDQEKYVSVGMVHEWLESFKQRATVPAGGAADLLSSTGDNPLLELLADSQSSKEAIEIAADVQAEAPPWDRDSSQYANAVYKRLHRYSTSDDTIIMEIPCGVCEVMTQEFTGSAAVESQISVEVLDIRDM